MIRSLTSPYTFSGKKREAGQRDATGRSRPNELSPPEESDQTHLNPTEIYYDDSQE